MSENALDDYYSRVFPAELIYKWLTNGRDPRSKDPYIEDTFPRREFSFTLPGDIYCRHKSYDSPDDLVKDLCRQKPEKIDIGAVWTLPPKSRNSYSNTIRYETVEKELVIDIDMTDYDNVRTCCQGATVCNKCWKFLAIACKSIDLALHESFGYNLRLWVFSGRRGIHCWVSDPEAKRLNDFRRKNLIDFLNSGPKKHTPFIQIFGILKQAFEDIIVKDQNLLVDQQHVDVINEIISGDEKEGIAFGRVRAAESSLIVWREILNVLSQKAGEMTLMKIVFKFLYPRLDVNVSRGTNHLLKSPFSVHPSTRKVCIPFEVSEVDSFDLSLVPTVEETVEGNSQFERSVEMFSRYIEKIAAKGREERRKVVSADREMQIDQQEI